jgi:hypothetical protein
MSMPSPKELKSLAKAMRQSGIKTFKGDGFELTLSDEALAPKPKRSSKQSPEMISPANSRFESDTPTDEELLLWSVGDEGTPFDPFEKRDE